MTRVLALRTVVVVATLLGILTFESASKSAVLASEPVAQPSAIAGSRFVPRSPTRIFDSRTDIPGRPARKVSAPIASDSSLLTASYEALSHARIASRATLEGVVLFVAACSTSLLLVSSSSRTCKTREGLSPSGGRPTCRRARIASTS